MLSLSFANPSFPQHVHGGGQLQVEKEDSRRSGSSKSSAAAAEKAGGGHRQVGLRPDPEPLQVPADEALQTGKM